MQARRTGPAAGGGGNIGILALQGDFGLHRQALSRLGIASRDVRRPEDLDGLGGVILPGGESSTMLRLMDGTPMEEAMAAFHERGGALFGTCAGLILLAAAVTAPAQRSLALLDVDVQRNGYGRQIDSFETDLAWPGEEAPLRGVFIRAPRITRVGPNVAVLIERGGEPQLVRAGRVLAATFHPEATEDPRVHRYFVERVMETHGEAVGVE
jgi:5'-phosphate synthase pdxT subunit